MAYNWRHMTEEEKRTVLQTRQNGGQPWHGPPHGLERHWYHLTAACYEHTPLIGKNPLRMANFERDLLTCLAQECEKVSVWCVLPTHYHVLVQCRCVPHCRQAVGRLHGKFSHLWNVEDNQPGRKCWHRCLPLPVKSESHRWAIINYIHHNPVRHEYTDVWQDWVFSSAWQYLEEMGREEAVRIWREYPILDMGKEWDEH